MYKFIFLLGFFPQGLYEIRMSSLLHIYPFAEDAEDCVTGFTNLVLIFSAVGSGEKLSVCPVEVPPVNNSDSDVKVADFKQSRFVFCTVFFMLEYMYIRCKE